MFQNGIFLSGFPWSYLAHSQHNFLLMVQVVSLTGSYFLSFLIVAVNCIVFLLLRRKRVSLLYMFVIAALMAASLTFGYVRMKDKVEATLTTAIVQGNVSQEFKWDEVFKAKTVSTYSQLSLQQAGSVDLVIWPETAMPFVFGAEPAGSIVAALSETLSTHLLFGALSRDGQGRFYNSAYVYGKKGEFVGRYDKVHLVPFGEYTPLRHYFPFLERISVATGDFFPAKGTSPYQRSLGRLVSLSVTRGDSRVSPWRRPEKVPRSLSISQMTRGSAGHRPHISTWRSMFSGQWRRIGSFSGLPTPESAQSSTPGVGPRAAPAYSKPQC